MSFCDEFLDLVTMDDRIPYWQIMVPILADVLITMSQGVFRPTLTSTSSELQWSVFWYKEFFRMADWPPGQTSCTMTIFFVTGKIDPSVLAVFHDLIQYQHWRIIVTTLKDGQITLTTLTDVLDWPITVLTLTDNLDGQIMLLTLTDV